MRTDGLLWHGGFPGLREGDVLRPGFARRTHNGCAICAARERGASLGGIDPPSARAAVYLTADKEYARFYASLWGRGDLYVVQPQGELAPSDEDHFPSWTAPEARIVRVYQRAVLLTMRERRALFRRWEVADREHDARKAVAHG